MQVSTPNNVKIYNLSAGKSLPEWLSEKKRRSLLKKNVDLRRRIELIQDFDMPGVSTSVKISKDGESVIATGIYKPRVKCFDVNNLSLKFERCFDSEVVNFQIISDDYSKMVFLQCDRHVEFHAAHGKYYRLRIPRFGRDLQYHYPSCDLFIVGVSNDIYRLNLERGQFLQPFVSDASVINKCSINPVHHLLVVGTHDGKVEAWDPRARNKVGTLDCGFHCVTQDTKLEALPSVTSLNFQGGLTLGVGTATGQVLLYDIRAGKPFLVKDHMYGLPIRNIEFHDKMNLVYSMDSSILKIWEKNTGKIYTSIEAQSDLNDLCVVPKTGLLFTACENAKMQSYYIPSLGPAPKWCSFLDNLTEELEELDYETIYDDYKFITEKELEELGLVHLRGTNLVRAYMHGHFIDVRLYRKARDVAKPFAFEEYKKRKIREKIEEDRVGRIQLNKLPEINKELALKLMEHSEVAKKKKTKENAANILKDDRFKALFTNPDFQVDKTSEEYNLLNPLISHLDKNIAKKLKLAEENAALEKDEQSASEKGNSSMEEDSPEESSSDDDDKRAWLKEVKKKYKLIKKNREENESEDVTLEKEKVNEPQLYELKEGVEFRGARPIARRVDKATLQERLEKEKHRVQVTGSRGSRQMTFAIGKRKSRGGRESTSKVQDRKTFKGLLRPAKHLSMRKKS